MSKRTRKGGMSTWWTVAVLVAAVGLLVWWLSARRAEAPGLPASQPGARALSQEPPAGQAPGHDEITNDEKADLERIIRERGAASPKP